MTENESLPAETYYLVQKLSWWTLFFGTSDWMAKTRYFYSKIIFLFLIEIREKRDGKPLWMKIGFKQKPKQKRKLRKIMSDIVAIRHSEWRWQRCIQFRSLCVSCSFEKDKGGDKADPAIVCSKWREETLKHSKSLGWKHHCKLCRLVTHSKCEIMG